MTNDEIVTLAALTPSAAPASSKLDTAAWFDSSHLHTELSPIDEFIENLYAINRIYLGAQSRSEYSPTLGSLAYLGMVSAAESYFRSLLRRLILTDAVCLKNASSRMVSYGAAMHHEPALLPEALLENSSLASKKNVAAELKMLCSVTRMTKDGGVPPPLELLFENFEAICQIRHCGIHRFGKLGSQQALRLGIDTHGSLLEKPLKLSVDQLQDVAEALEALVRSVNSYCFNDIIRRTHTNGPGSPDNQQYSESWQLDFVADSDRFSSYYSIFAAMSGPLKSEPIRTVYDAFLAFITFHDSRPGRPGRP